MMDYNQPRRRIKSQIVGVDVAVLGLPLRDRFVLVVLRVVVLLVPLLQPRRRTYTTALLG